jgi:hypothetical protein
MSLASSELSGNLLAERKSEQNLAQADMADPRRLNEIIWFSVRGAGSPMPEIARLPAFDAFREGILEDDEEEEREERERRGKRAKAVLAENRKVLR